MQWKRHRITYVRYRLARYSRIQNFVCVSVATAHVLRSTQNELRLLGSFNLLDSIFLGDARTLKELDPSSSLNASCRHTHTHNNTKPHCEQSKVERLRDNTIVTLPFSLTCHGTREVQLKRASNTPTD